MAAKSKMVLETDKNRPSDVDIQPQNGFFLHKTRTITFDSRLLPGKYKKG
jgi:hypothetical protein